ncbi:hypothetical protein BC936DRAFT_140149 [Jimgerdemannia flammicorona]|uniref:AAA-ATPase-like domain-containing protein n=1 Tax=Jimgerdemannia flammicorona TaxID=994334 RepID=A0A433AZ15_9FUNG|nr:hypothetical protein BC936DRAFT_140149 [Jimgerdemannia flammicorona]
MAQKPWYVDKTMLIHDLCQTDSTVTLVLRPHGFGKTTNLLMLRTFFELVHDESITEKKYRRKLFDRLHIGTHHPTLLDTEFGRYPIIHLNLRHVTKCTWEGSLNKLRDVIGEIFRKHHYVIECLSGAEKDEFTAIEEKDTLYQEYDSALQKLSMYLHRFHGAKCVVLVDEYETPAFDRVDVPISQQFNEAYYRTMIGILTRLYSSLLGDNPYLHKAFMVGILPVETQVLFSSCNDCSIHSMAHSDFSTRFGFTESELNKGDARGGGYWCGGVELHRPQYNKNGFADTIRQLIAHIDSAKIIALLDRKHLRLDRRDSIEFDQLCKRDDATVWTFLYHAGYITMHEGQFEIPNAHVYMQWVSCVAPDLSEPSLYEALLDMLVASEIEAFHRKLGTITIEHVCGWLPEMWMDIFYHAFCFGADADLRRRGYAVTGTYTAEQCHISAKTQDTQFYIRVTLGENVSDQEVVDPHDSVAKVHILGIAFQGNQTCVSVRNHTRIV